MKEEFYDIAFRKQIYHTLEELQEDVETWLKKYNELRPHSGKYCYGKTPLQTFLASKAIAQEKQLDKLFKLAENEDASSEVSSLVGSIAPSTEAVHVEGLQGASHTEAEMRSQLTDDIVVS